MMIDKVLLTGAAVFSKHMLQAYDDAMEQRLGKRLSGPGVMERLPMFVNRIFAGQLMKTHRLSKN